MAPVGLLVLRAAMAIVFVTHGAHWLFGAFGGANMGPGGLATMTAFYDAAGMPAAFPFVVVSGSLQLAGGLLLGAGLFTRVSAGTLAALELVKLWFDSARWGFFLNWALDPTRGHGMEFALLVMAVLACLAVSGAGDWSFDGFRARTSQARAAGRARIRERG